MTIRRVSAGPGLPAGFPFSLACEGNGLVFISGMPALDAGGTFVAGTFEEEADRAWARIVSIAAASGCGPSDFLYVPVLLADIGNYAGINTWWQKQFPDPAKAPARLTFQAGSHGGKWGALHPGAHPRVEPAGARTSRGGLGL